MFTLLPGEGLVGCPHVVPSVSCPGPFSEHSLLCTPPAPPLPPVLAGSLCCLPGQLSWSFS